MRHLRVLTPLVAALLLCAHGAQAQKPAPCAQRQAPEFNGFRIGMAPIEVRDRIMDPSALDSKLTAANKIGTQALRIAGADLKDEYAEGVDELNLTFVDKRLASLRTTFNGAQSWGGAEEFFKQVSEKLGLPAGAGSTRGSGGNEKYRVECPTFVVILSYSFGVSPNVTIYDAAAQKLVNDRSEKNPDGEVKDIRITPPSRPRTPGP